MDITGLCHRELITVNSSAPIRQAAEAMRRRHVGALMVIDAQEPGRIIGIVTDRDLVVNFLAFDLPFEKQTIGPLCCTSLVGVAPTAIAHEAVETMLRARAAYLLGYEP